jgi:streptogramin lyase
VLRRTFAIAALAVLASPALAAEAVSFKHEKSVYIDAKEAPLRGPEGVGCDDQGAFVVADTGNARLLTFTWKDGAVSGGAEVKVPQLLSPVRVQIDSKGNVLVLDRRAKKIARLDVKGAFAAWIELKPAAGAVAAIPASFKLDAADNVYVLDVAGRRVVVLNPQGEASGELPLPAEGTFTDVAADAAGRIYVVEATRAAVWVAEKGASSFKDLTGSLKDRLSFPGYVAAVRGKLFVVDQNGMAVVVVGQDGSFQGRQLALGWTDGLLYYPGQLCVNANGDAFIADRQNNRVQVFATAK